MLNHVAGNEKIKNIWQQKASCSGNSGDFIEQLHAAQADASHLRCDLAMPQWLIVVPQKMKCQITPPCKNTKKLVLQKNVGLMNREGTGEKC